MRGDICGKRKLKAHIVYSWQTVSIHTDSSYAVRYS